MTGLQKVIKYGAIIFAICIICSIVSFGFEMLSFFIHPKDEIIGVVYEPKNIIDNLNIDLKGVNLSIQKGSTFSIETDSKYVKVKEENGKLSIKDTQKIGINKKGYTVNITIPDNTNFNKVTMDVGAGNITIDNLSANYFSLDMGAGNIKIENLEISNGIDIDGGAGKLEILSGSLNNLDLDMGVGEANINIYLYGNSKLECGIGKLKLDLMDKLENYTIKVEKGIGSIIINKDNMSNNSIIGNGRNNISLEGGIGSIIINTQD